MQKLKIFKLFFLLIFIILINQNFNNNKLYSKNTNISDSVTKSPVFQKTEPITPYQVFTGDTLRHVESSERVSNPGSDNEVFTADQDSAYHHALKSNLPLTTRMRYDLKNLTSNYEIKRQIEKGTPIEIVMKNMEMNSKMLTPSGNDMVQSQINLINALSIPHLKEFNPYGGLVSFAQIAQFFGLAEDVSPIIKYKLDYITDVEVVVYSMQATVIATLYHGEQDPGSYTFTWNFRNSLGKPMPPGDYVAEVRIGTSRIVRKRIVLQ